MLAIQKNSITTLLAGLSALPLFISGNGWAQNEGSKNYKAIIGQLARNDCAGVAKLGEIESKNLERVLSKMVAKLVIESEIAKSELEKAKTPEILKQILHINDLKDYNKLQRRRMGLIQEYNKLSTKIAEMEERLKSESQGGKKTSLEKKRSFLYNAASEKLKEITEVSGLLTAHKIYVSRPWKTGQPWDPEAINAALRSREREVRREINRHTNELIGTEYLNKAEKYRDAFGRLKVLKETYQAFNKCINKVRRASPGEGEKEVKVGRAEEAESKSHKSGKAPAPPPLKRLSGRYNAGLHFLRLVSPSCPWLNQAGRNAPIPLVLDVGPTGRVTADVEYRVPENHWAEDRLKIWRTKFCRVRFKIDGNINPVSGKTALLIYDVENRWGGFPSNREHEQENVIKSEVILTGWQIPGPESQSLLKTPIMNVNKHSNAFPWIPRARKQRDDTWEFLDDGFFGVQGMRGGNKLARWKVYSTTARWGGGKPKDRGREKLERDSNKPSSTVTWYLQIYGPAAPPPQAPTGKGDLLGVGIWPRSPAKTTPTKPITLMAVGVYSSNVFKVEDLSKVIEWHVVTGVRRRTHTKWTPSEDPRASISGSTFEAMPGTYYVRARMKDSGEWLKDVIKIVVAWPDG